LEDREKNVVNDRMSLMAIQVKGLTAESVEEKRRAMAFSEATSLSFSYKNLCKIDYLTPFEALTKLQLDNNIITEIKNLAHLTNLRALDLSFNNLAKIEGLETLTKLKDLSLYNNQIATLEGMDAFCGTLESFSVGNNALERLDEVMYLRRFEKLRIINLAGNPMCEEEDYVPYVLSHLPDLKYLDHRLARSEAKAMAREQYADEMSEIETREEEEKKAERRMEERRKKDAADDEMNMLGVADLFERMLGDDPEYAKLKALPNEQVHPLVDGLDAFQEKFAVLLEDFKLAMAAQAERKKAEEAEWRETLDAALAEKDAEARELIDAHAKRQKRAFRDLNERGDDVNEEEYAETKVILRSACDALKEKLMASEMRLAEVVRDLVFEFDREFSEVADASRSLIAAFFTEVRSLEDEYAGSVQEAAGIMLETFATGDLDDVATEDAKVILADKDMFNNAVQAHHDFHVNVIDAKEDQLATGEKTRLDGKMAEIRKWERKRNRERIAEIAAAHKRFNAEAEAELGDGEEDA